jgi:hypothetical protein
MEGKVWKEKEEERGEKEKNKRWREINFKNEFLRERKGRGEKKKKKKKKTYHMPCIIHSNHTQIGRRLAIPSNNTIHHPNLTRSRQKLIMMRPLQLVCPHFLPNKIANKAVNAIVYIHTNTRGEDIRH